MGSPSERGQVLVESALSMALVTMILLAAVAVTLMGHQSTLKEEYKTEGRGTYGNPLEQSQRTLERLGHRSQ